MLAFVGHLLIALIFIIGFYIMVSYSSLNTEIENIKYYLNKLEASQESRNQLIEALKIASTELAEVQRQLKQCDYEIDYYKVKYNSAVHDYAIRKHSLFSKGAIALFNKLDQDFEMQA